MTNATSDKKRRRILSAVSFAGAATAMVAVKCETERRKRRRIQPTFHRCSLHSPLCGNHNTAWRQLLSCGTSSDFLVSVNVDRQVFFEILLPCFNTERGLYKYGSPYRHAGKKTGRPCSITTEDILGLVLWSVKTSSRRIMLCPIFGLVPTSVMDWFRYGLRVLYRTLKKLPDARIEWPSHAEMKESSDRLQSKRESGPCLKGIFAVVDGARMRCADYIDPNIQNGYYEGYTCQVEVTNLFVYNFKGELIHAAMNYPGSWHDSKIAYASGLFDPKLGDEMTPPGFAIIGDSAFATRFTNGKVVRARKATETADIPTDAVLAAVDMILQRLMPSERQSAEWGVRALKAPFGILRLPLTSN